ncbi:MAG: right-handed parallel beta-helix repeat-containing protein, partial [Chloroflexota bacterium]
MNVQSRLTLLSVCLGLFMTAILVLVGASFSGVSLAAPQTCVPGPHNGHLTADEEWCLADSPHLMEGTVTVDPGVTLTIEPGVLVKVPGWPWYISVNVQGNLEAIGTPAQPITFTSTTGGPTWAGIIVDGGSANLLYTTVEYACGSYTNVRVQNGGRLEMANSLVQECHVGYSLRVEEGTADVSNTTFTTSDLYPIYVVGASSVVTLTDNIITGNERDRILLAPGAMMGHDTTLTPQAVWDGYELEGTLTVPPTVTLTIEPGVLVKVPGWPWYISVNVQGNLEAIGTPTQPITFTSTTGGPTWAGIIVDGGSANLLYATVEYACGSYTNIRVQNGGRLEMANSLVQECHVGYSLRVEEGTADVSNTTFTTSDLYPIYVVGASSVVTLTDNIITGNYYDRILLASDAMMGHDTTLTPQTIWEGYELEGTFTVPPTVTLTIEPGVIIKAPGWPWHIHLNVQGHLEAVGTPTQPITFTSTTGDPTWKGIVINGGAADLEYVTVEYACSEYSNIKVENGGRLEMANSLVQECHFGGGAGEYMFWVTDGLAEVESTTFIASDLYLIYVSGPSTVLINDSAIEGASSHGLLVEGDEAWVKVTGSTLLSNGTWSGDAVRNTGEATVILSGDPEGGNFIAYSHDYGANQTGLTGQIIATYNYWGDPSGPTHPGNPGGLGDAVSDRVLYDPWLTEAPGGIISPDTLVQTFGPEYVSPGDSINLGIAYQNTLTDTWSNAVIVAELPDEVEYLSSSANGQYWASKHQVLWRLGDVPPGASQMLAIQVHYDWGLPAHLPTRFSALVAAENLDNQWVDLEQVLVAYDVLVGTEVTYLTDEEFQALLADDPELNALYQQVQGEGFTYYGGAFLETNGVGQTSLKLSLLDIGRPDVVAYLYRDDSGSLVMEDSPAELVVYNLDGGYRYDKNTQEVVTWGELTGGLAAALNAGCAPGDDCG